MQAVLKIDGIAIGVARGEEGVYRGLALRSKAAGYQEDRDICQKCFHLRIE